MQTKVEHVRQHDIGYTTIDREPYRIKSVAEGKLVLVERPLTKESNPTLILGADCYEPIIISETEKMEVGDWFYWAGTTPQIQQSVYGSKAGHPVFKILALPEHFSNEQLQIIVSGHLKDGDKVLVECYREPEKKRCGIVNDTCSYGEEYCECKRPYLIKLNSSNHITLHKVEEKMYGKEIVWKAYQASNTVWNQDDEGLKVEFEEWFEQNIEQ